MRKSIHFNPAMDDDTYSIYGQTDLFNDLNELFSGSERIVETPVFGSQILY